MHHGIYLLPTLHARRHKTHRDITMRYAQVQDANSRLTQELEQLRKEKLALEEAFKRTAKAKSTPVTAKTEPLVTSTVGAVAQNLDAANTAAVGPASDGVVKQPADAGSDGARDNAAAGKSLRSATGKMQGTHSVAVSGQERVNAQDSVSTNNKDKSADTKTRAGLSEAPSKTRTQETAQGLPRKETAGALDASKHGSKAHKESTGAKTEAGLSGVSREKSAVGVLRTSKPERNASQDVTSEMVCSEMRAASISQLGRTDRQRSPVKRDLNSSAVGRDASILGTSRQGKGASPPKKPARTRSLVSCVFFAMVYVVLIWHMNAPINLQEDVLVPSLQSLCGVCFDTFLQVENSGMTRASCN
jgi:hypothetical protein